MSTGDPKMRKRLLIVVGLAIVVALALMFIPGVGDEPDSAVSGLQDGDAGGVEAGDVDPMDPDGDGKVYVSDGEGGLVPIEDSSLPDNTVSDGSTFGDIPVPEDPEALMDVRIMFWNDTAADSPAGCEVTIAGSSWAPNVGKDSDQGTIAGLAYGEPLPLDVYPDGPDGEKVTVYVAFDADMISGSEQDAIHVEVSDEKVRVLGNPVENFDMSFDRF